MGVMKDLYTRGGRDPFRGVPTGRAKGGLVVTIEGDRELEREFNELPEKLRRTVFRKAVRASARPVLEAARQNLHALDNPLTDRRSTYALARTLRIRAIKRSRRKVGVHILTGTREELGIPPKAKGYWPAALELGHFDHRSNTKVAPRSYLRKALLEKETFVKAIMEVEIRRLIPVEMAKKGMPPEGTE